MNHDLLCFSVHDYEVQQASNQYLLPVLSTPITSLAFDVFSIKHNII